MTETIKLIGQTLGQNRYHVKRKLGEGGMAFVLLAFDKNLGIDVVLKVPKQEMIADPESVARFNREIRAMLTLTHPHIVKVKDVGECGGVPFYVMDLLAGGTLNDRFEISGDRRIPQSPESLTDWLEPVARALDYSHKHKFIHRDIKPQNILFDASGNAYVSDYGIVKATDSKNQTMMTQPGMVIGTCSYIAPEVTEGKKYDGRADQYALVATVYEVLSARVPFDGDNLPAIIMQQLTGKVPPLKEVVPALRSSLMPVLEKGLSREPMNRYANCEAFAKAVIAIIQPSTVTSSTGLNKPKTGSAPVAKPGTRIVCPSCRKKLLLPPDLEGEHIICPVCKVELTVANKPIEKETKTSKSSKSETKVAPRKAVEPASKPQEAAAAERTTDPKQSNTSVMTREVWIVLGVAAALLGIFGLIAIVFFSGDKGGDRRKIQNTK